MRFVVDMNLSPRWVSTLVEAGFEAAHWSSLGAANATDKEIMTYARSNGFVVLTHDLDFGTILATTQSQSPSVVQIRSDDVSPEAIGTEVTAGLRQMEAELRVGALLTIGPKRTRMRVLPLRLRD
jgi:predicted nuclease of predicted toxin-antitoxin system